MRIEGEQKYFSASDAREVSNEIANNLMNEELDWIYRMIDRARFEGKYEVIFSNKTLRKSTKEFLISKGFNIDHFSGCQWDPADDTTISW